MPASSFSFIHSSTTTPNFAIFTSGAAGTSLRGDIAVNALELGLDLRVIVRQLADAAEHFRKVERFDGDAVPLHQLFAEADGVERRGTRPQHAHAEVLQPFDHPAGGGKGLQVSEESRGCRRRRCAATSTCT